MTADLTNPIFNNEAKAVEHMEASRWGADLSALTCPLCGSAKCKKMGGETQAGMFLCGDCRGKFTVRTGSVFERSHIPLHKWLLATHLMASSKKGISAHQLHRMLGITYKSAWFMAHRIREAMGPTAKDKRTRMGGEGKTVEADETYFGRKKGRTAPKGGAGHKHAVVSLVERGGPVRSFYVNDFRGKDVHTILANNVDHKSATKARSTKPLVGISPNTKRSTTAKTNTCGATLRQTRLKACSPSSSAAWLEPTSIAANSTCNAT